MTLQRILRSPLVALLLTCLPAATSAGADDLTERIASNSYPIQIEDGKPQGPGLDWLVGEAAKADYFLFGEQHATADIAELATGLYRRLAPLGTTVAAVEVGPWSTPVLESLLRSGDLDDYLGSEGRELAFPFFFFAEEAEFGNAVIETSPRKEGALWGVDQEFIAAAPIVLDLLEKHAASPEQNDALQSVRAHAAENPMLLGAGEDELWQSLLSVFEDGEARHLLEDVLLSRQIYAPFVGRGGAVQTANAEREHYMKRWFLRHLDRTVAETGESPRIFLKFGANHVAYGHSPTDVLTLGTFVHELAVAREQTTFSLHADCAGGEVRDPRSGTASPCSSYFLRPESTLAPLLAPGHVVDLRALRPHLGKWKELDARSRALVLAYDAYVALPDPRAATPIIPPSVAASN